MLEIIAVVIFLWLGVKAVGLALKLTWCAAKAAAVVLFAVALPLLVGCILFAGGIILLLPIALIGAAFGILRRAV